VAASVAAHQLGFPPADATQLVSLVNRTVQRAPGQAGATAAGLAARGELREYLIEVVAERRAHPHAEPIDALDGLLACDPGDGDPGDGPLDDGEVADQVSTLFVGGSETLPKVLADAVCELGRDPGQRDALARDLAHAPRVFEEALRHGLPLQFVGRTLVVDARIAGVQMGAGQRIVALLICANRDEREFADPERFDSTRPIARNLGFGHGVHVCIGAHVARLEGTVMLQELLARHPRYEVDDRDLRREGSEFHVSWAEMPIVVA
jgi:cytochrome P450